MNLKSTAQSVFILLSEREVWLCTRDGSSLGSLLETFSVESWGKAWACYRGREPEDSEIERRISFAHQPREYLALWVTLESCEEVEECTFGAEGMSIWKGRYKKQLLKLFILSSGYDCSQWNPCLPFLLSNALDIIMTYFLCGFSNCPWDPLNQGTFTSLDVKIRILEFLPQSSHSSFGRNFEPLPQIYLVIYPKKEFTMHFLYLNVMIVICSWNLVYYCLFLSYWIIEELFSLLSVHLPLPDSRTKQIPAYGSCCLWMQFSWGLSQRSISRLRSPFSKSGLRIPDRI